MLSVPEQLKDDGAIPKTPEIISSLITMTNPLDRCLADGHNSLTSNGFKGSHDGTVLTSNGIDGMQVDTSTLSGKNSLIQRMRTQLIKEELKVTLQKKKRNSGSENGSSTNSTTPAFSPSEELIRTMFGQDNNAETDDEGTVEDEEKRKRRRERNKIAATKCRQKKKEQANSLLQESEYLQNMNQNLKMQIRELEVQRNGLVDTLNTHKLTCPLGIR